VPKNEDGDSPLVEAPIAASSDPFETHELDFPLVRRPKNKDGDSPLVEALGSASSDPVEIQELGFPLARRPKTPG
jgi:hypothetical protein